MWLDIARRRHRCRAGTVCLEAAAGWWSSRGVLLLRSIFHPIDIGPIIQGFSPGSDLLLVDYTGRFFRDAKAAISRH
jgi:hypothetical protein